MRSFKKAFTENDRINNDLGYSTENCRWVDIATQNRNKRKREAGCMK